MKITVTDGQFDAYVARPAVTPAPAIVVIQEIFGVNADLRRTCAELAAKGFIAIAPELFWRDVPGLDLNSWNEAEWKQGLSLYMAYDVDRGVHDIEATIDAARTLDGASGKVGVMGFCLGGLMTFLTAARTAVDAAASYYGGNTDKYVAEAVDIRAPIIVHLADQDEFMSPTARDAVRRSLRDKHDAEVFDYAGCSHAFARHTGSHYDADAAALANGRTEAFFRRTLGA